MLVTCEATGSWNEPGYQYVYVGGKNLTNLVLMHQRLFILLIGSRNDYFNSTHLNSLFAL